MPTNPPTTLDTFLTQILNFYDKRLPQQPSGQGKEFFRRYLPCHKEPHIEQLRHIRNGLNKGSITNDEAMNEIRILLSEDPGYPHLYASHVSCELILDYCLFKGEIFQGKKARSYRASLLEVIMKTNLFYLVNQDAINLIEEHLRNSDDEYIEFNQMIVASTANSCVESILFILAHLNNSVDLDIRTKYCANNALMIAIAKGRYHKDTVGESNLPLASVIDALLDHDTLERSINTRDRLGMTALHLAVLQGDDITANQLVNLGADLTIRDNKGKTALDYLNVTYNEASEHLEGYVEGVKSRAEFLKDKADRDNYDKMCDLIDKKIYTMPKQKKWELSRSRIRLLLTSDPDQQQRPLFSPNA